MKQRQEKKPKSESTREWRSKENSLEQISLAVGPRAGTATQEAVAGVKMMAGGKGEARGPQEGGVGGARSWQNWS